MPECEERVLQNGAIEPRFDIKVVAAEYRNHKGVPFALFHHDGLPESVYEDWIRDGLDKTCPYLQSAVDESFSAQEVDTLREWFRSWGQDAVMNATPFTLISEPNVAGVGMMAVGGDDDFYMFSDHDDWPLPCEVWGYFNLSEAQSGPYVSDPSLSMLTVVQTENGIILKRPPF
jgi:hypothetical protein